MAKFQRRALDAEGIASVNFGKKEVRLVGREIYETENEREAELLRNDPVFVELVKNPKNRNN